MITLLNSRVMNAVRFVQQQSSSLWLVIGQATPWTSPYSDTNPPNDVRTASGVNNPVCAILGTPSWVYEDDVHGTISFVDATGTTRKFVEVSTQAEALENSVTQVLFFASTPASNMSGISLASFRQVGFATNLVPASGYADANFLAAANVTSWGVVETLESDEPQTVISTDTYEFSFIRQF